MVPGEIDLPQVAVKTKEVSLESLISQVSNGRKDQVSGVYVPSVLSLPIIQQPAGQPGFVSGLLGVATQFRMAASSGSIGLLAHNTLAGAKFSSLKLGDEVKVVYGDGSIRKYKVSGVYRYQALSPNSPESIFVDLDSHQKVSAAQLFKNMYAGSDHVTFQTCIQEGGEASWGRLFIIAEPV